MTQRHSRRGGAIFHAQFAEDLFQMLVHRARTHAENLANFPIGFAMGNPNVTIQHIPSKNISNTY
jgi:hypothetical protein